MARCSCAGSSCSCLITQGAGVVVTGQGSNADPYVVSAGPADPGVISQDVAGVLDLGSVGVSALARVVLHANVTDITLPVDGARIELVLEQDTTGGRTVNFPDLIAWPGGTEPVVTATAGSADWITLIKAGGVWYAVRIGTAIT